MRRAAKIDSNHNEIVKALRAVGATVQSLAAIGKGCPDILCGFRGVNHVFEIKDGSKPESARRLTLDETVWAVRWKGQYVVVNNVQEALGAIGVTL